MMRRFDPLRVVSVLWIDLLRATMTTSAEVPVDVSRCRSREKERMRWRLRISKRKMPTVCWVLLAESAFPYESLLAHCR